MSITNSLYIGISGLQAHGDAISVVGDNIANTSTVGFKRERAGFSDMLGGELGAQRLGGGVRMGATQTMWDQGAVQTTGNALDVAIRGGGLFMVKGNHDGQSGEFYTRDGRFSLDKSGYMVNQGGLRLQGYALDSAGVRSTSPGDLPLAARQSPPLATSIANMTLNLTGDQPYTTPVTVYDSLGAAHEVDVTFTPAGNGSWSWVANAEGAEVSGGTPGVPMEIANGQLQFNANGGLESQSMSSSGANFNGATSGQMINFDFGDDVASGGTGMSGTTQFSSVDGKPSVNATDIDGHGFGNLVDVSISSDGTIQGIFDNGDRINLAQLALAEVPNEDGLSRAGDGLYTTTASSGAALVGAPGEGARGALVSGALEGSNVDLGNELVTLIAYQRAFQANAKTVTTADEMMADVTNLKR